MQVQTAIRLDTQSKLLADSPAPDSECIFTIMDDIDQKHAIPYFILDNLLLRDISKPKAAVSRDSDRDMQTASS